MTTSAPKQTITTTGDTVPPEGTLAAVPLPTPAGQATLEAAQALAKKATAPATLRAYKADWTHFADWCAVHGFVPVPAAPAIVGAYLASLAGSHAPATIRRRLSALGKMHRFNDLAWNPAHREIQGPLQGALRTHARPPQKAAALMLPMLRQLLATCDDGARGRRDRALTEPTQLQARLSALMPFRVAADVLQHLLPIDAGKSPETLRSHTTLQVGKQLADEAAEKPPTAAAAITISLDSTFIRGCEDGERHLEVRVGNVETVGGGRHVFGAVARTETDIAALIQRTLETVGRTDTPR